MLLRTVLQVTEPHRHREYRLWAGVNFRCCSSERVPARSSEVIRSGIKFKSEIFDFASAAV